MNKTIKVALSMLLIFCVFFANMCTVFAVDGSQSTTDGEHGGGGMPFPDADGGLTEYDGSLVTYDYAKKNPKLFTGYDIDPFDINSLPTHVAMDFNMWINTENGDSSKIQVLNDMVLNSYWMQTLGNKDPLTDFSCVNAQYVYLFVSYVKGSSIKQKYVMPYFSSYPLAFKDGFIYVSTQNDSSTSRIQVEYRNDKPYLFSGTLGGGLFKPSPTAPRINVDGVEYAQDMQLYSSSYYLQTLVYPINGKIMPILDGGGNDITPPEHGGGGRPFGNIYDITVSPDLASKDFDVGEIDKIDITITNNSNTNGCFAVNFSKYSAKNTSPRTVMDEAAIFNYREKLHMYDVNGEGRYMYTPAIPLSAKSSKTISIPISYLDLSKLPKDDNGYIYMNFMELAGSVKPGLVSTQFKANKEYYFKLNFKPEYKPPEYGGGTSNEQYPTYDKDGNIVKPSDDPVFEDDWLNWGSNFLKNVTDIFSRIIDGMKSIAEYSGEFFSFLKSAFSFLPPEVWVILAVGISIVILLRIFGR